MIDIGRSVNNVSINQIINLMNVINRLDIN